MLISNNRLIEASRRIVDEAVAKADPVAQKTLSVASMMLGELALQVSDGFSEQQLQHGRELLREGAALAGIDVRAQIATLDALNEALIGVVTKLAPGRFASGNFEVDAYLARLENWERSFYSARTQHLKPRTYSAVPKLMPERLEGYLRERFPKAQGVKVRKAAPLAGGFSRSTWLVELDDGPDGISEFVIRAEQAANVLSIPGFSILDEFDIIRLAYEAGVLAPEPLWKEPDASRLGLRFLAVRRAPGSSYGYVGQVDRPISPELLASLVNGLAFIHTIDPRAHAGTIKATHLGAWLSFETMQQATRHWIELWRDEWQRGGPDSPILARSFEWLLANVPHTGDAPKLLHSDYGLGNILIENERVSAVLDWEYTHLGDHAEELSWLILNLRSQVPADRILKLYAAAGGKPVENFRLRYFEVFTAVKMMICGTSAWSQFERDEQANPLFFALGLQAMMPYAADIETLIHAAEAAR